MEVEIKMLRFSLGVTRMDGIRNENIRGTEDVRCLERKSETRLRWFGHEQRRNSEDIWRSMMRLDLLGRRSGGRPKDVEKKDMKLMICCGEP